MARGPKSHMVRFIEDIPNDKLIGGMGEGTIYEDVNFRLDMQCYTTVRPDHPRCYNLQVQVNKGCKIKSIALIAPDSIAALLLSVDHKCSAEKIRELLAKTVTGRPVRAPQLGSIAEMMGL